MKTIRKISTIIARRPEVDTKLSASWIVMFFTGCLLLTQPLMAKSDNVDNLADVKWLEKNLKNAGVLILDASPAQIYNAKHIPGAISVDIYSWYGLRELPKADMEKIYQKWGISPGRTIVIYDQGGTILATRLFYSLYYHGFPIKDLLILDGGLSKWEESGLPVTKEIVHAVKGTFRIIRTNEDVKSGLPEFVTASGDPANNVLLEALGADWHFGEMLAFNKAGHIPNAIMLPAADFFKTDKTFKSTEEIRIMLDYLGISPEKTIYTHCGGGVAASVPFFALKFLVKYPEVKLYRESQLGWLSDERGLPYWTYDAPNMLREASWLQFWSGRMIRMYGGAEVSIVDVRNAEAFYEGHVPYAVNIPADVFRNGISNPLKLTGILGPSGVNASHEAVIISGAGLTKEAALAFVMLEKTGQKKVSVFMDSMDEWTQAGFTTTKDSTVISTKMVPNVLSIPPSDYPANIHSDIVITNRKNNYGLYPRIMIASGINVPDKIQGGKVVHIPYTSLLNADGTPKAAKEIWNTLSKAGIPRYADLVCFSDDPSEAAVNYFILKLMGYPDVKILVENGVNN